MAYSRINQNRNKQEHMPNVIPSLFTGAPIMYQLLHAYWMDH